MRATKLGIEVTRVQQGTLFRGAKSKRPRGERIETAAAPFSVADALEFADRVLAAPPAFPHIDRPTPRGARVIRFALPLELCKPQNRLARAGAQNAGWAIGKLKKDILLRMLGQTGRVRDPLSGRPQVLCLRLSSSEPDKFADWAKHAIDRLTVKHSGMGFLRDDNPRDAEIHQWWEPAPRGKGCVIIEVRSER